MSSPIVPSDAERLVAEALGVLDPAILNASGAVLYSAASTLRKGRYYFLGLNPGGGSEGTRTVRQSLKALSTTEANAYLSENWSGGGRTYKCGGHPLQVNAQALFNAIGEELSAVCASNLIFLRSAGEAGSGGRKAATMCWPVHELILRMVSPEVIVTFGAVPFKFFANMLGLQQGASQKSGHGDWMCSIARRPGGPLLIGLPHLSRYALHRHPEVLEWIRDQINAVPTD